MLTKLPSNFYPLIPKEVWQVFKKFSESGYEIYLVGGGVKNLWQNQIPIHCDFTTNATPEIIQSLFPDSYYDNIFGTVGITIKTSRGEEIYEITTYRTEQGYTDRRRPDQVCWGEKLEEDLKRRDFTINAVVVGPAFAKATAGKPAKWDGKTLELIDLFDGQKDFSNKIIRAVGEAKQRFSEDALRMMRAIRFAAQLGFTIEEKTFQAIKNNAQLLKKISWERIRDELLKILASPHSADGYQLLRNAGLAEIILPEMEKTFGVEQKSPGRHHIYDVGTHSLLSLKNCQSADPLVRLATLIHDIGKPLAYKKEKDGLITFYNHELIGTSIARNIGRRLRLPRRDLTRLVILVRWHQFTVDERQTDKAIRRFIRNVGRENLEDMLELRRADRLGGGAQETSWRLEAFKKKLIEVQKQPFTVADLKVDGHDVMEILKLSSGPIIGKVLEVLFAEVEEDKAKNTREYLLKRIKPLGQKFLKNH